MSALWLFKSTGSALSVDMPLSGKETYMQNVKTDEIRCREEAGLETDGIKGVGEEKRREQAKEREREREM